MYYISQTSLEEQTKNVHVCILLCISYKYIMKGTLIDWIEARESDSGYVYAGKAENLAAAQFTKVDISQQLQPGAEGLTSLESLLGLS